MALVPSDRPAAAVVDRIGAGFQNLGNTCFLNSVLQCLLHTVPLVQTIRSLDHRIRCSFGDDGKFCSLCAVLDLMDQSHHSFLKTISPEFIVDNLSNIHSSFKRYQQEDAHEFLHFFLERIDENFSKFDSISPSSLHDSSIIHKIFGGRLRSVVRCCDCGHCSETFEPMRDLSLEIDETDSLNGALLSFTKVEDLHATFTCEGCKSQVSVEKQLMLHELPSIIMLHLKRFKGTGDFFDKIEKHVGYPMELDLKPFVSSVHKAETRYDLYALVVHSGWTLHSGHYYCLVRTSPDAWYRMDDCEVSRVSADEVSEEQAYILFYIKHGHSPWFSNLTWHQKPDFFPILDKDAKTSPSSVLDSIESSDDSMERPAHEESNTQADAYLDSLASKGEGDRSLFVELCEPSTSETRINDVTDSVKPQGSTMVPTGSVRTEDVRPDELFENYREILPPSANVAKYLTKFKSCGRKQETINRQLVQMTGSRRRAILQCLEPSVRINSPGNSTQKKRVHPDTFAEDSNRAPSLKTR